MIQLGEQSIEEFYLGGREADESLLNARTLDTPASVYMSAQDILHNNILDNETTAILAYDWPLRGFYKYAQQLEMESNGKRVDKNGNNIDYQTNPIVWGGCIAALFLPANLSGYKRHEPILSCLKRE